MDWKHPSVTAVTGPPFTGKSNIAFGIATRIRRPCILLSLDHILDSISPSCYSPTRPPPHEADQLFLKAFNILCQIIEKQLRLGVSIVLDSPFSSRTQLDRLISLSTSLEATKIIIVECKVKAKYTWQRRFEKKDDSLNVPIREVQNWPDRWFKPRSWDDVTKLIGVCDAGLNEPIPGVSRLLVNVDKHQETDPIAQAIQCLVFCEDDRCIDLDKFREFNCSHDREASGSSKGEKKLIGFWKGSQKDRFCSEGHCITIESQGLDYKTNCGACEERISGAAYTCNACVFSLHKSCAELGAGKRSFTLYKCPSIILRGTDYEPPIYSFPERHACLQCREEGYDYDSDTNSDTDSDSDSDCVSCAFESLVKCRLIPTVIDHDCHQHKLSLFLRRITNRAQGAPEYQCAACGLEGKHFGYMCTGFEQITYHAECVLLPYPVMHSHGGREHLLELRSSRDKELEEYPCDFCLETMNPEDWYYHCPQCPQTYHLHCAFVDEEQTLESILISGDLDFVIDKNGSKGRIYSYTSLLTGAKHFALFYQSLLKPTTKLRKKREISK